MALTLFNDFLQNLLQASWLGTSGLPGALSATPTVWVQGVDATYMFDPSHDIEADFASAATEFVYSLSGELDTDATFDHGVLWLADGGPGELTAPTGTTSGIIVWIDHGSWVQLVGYWSDFYGSPFAPVDTDDPTLAWPRQLHSVFETLPVRGVGLGEPSMYPRVAEQALGALIGGSTRTDLVATTTLTCDLTIENTRFVWSHQYLSDIPDEWWAQSTPTPETIPGVDLSVNLVAFGANVAVANPVVFTAADGEDAHGLIFWHDSGDPTTSYLIGFCPTGLLPLYGDNVTVPFTQTTELIQFVSQGS